MSDSLTKAGPTNGESSPPLLRRGLTAARWAFTPCAVLALLYVIWTYRTDLAQTVVTANASLLLLAVALWCVMHALSPLFVYLIVSPSSDAIKLHTVYDIHMKNIPARYIPGGIWGTVGRVTDLAAAGANRGTLVTFVGLENFGGLATAATIGSLMLISSRGFDALDGMASVILAVGIAALVLAPLASNIRGINARLQLSGVPYIRVMAIVSASWVIASLSFVTFYLSVLPGPATNGVIDVAGSYLLSWAAGFIALFAPQGIGVFEVVASSLLKGASPLAQTAALFAGFRVVILAADFVVWACIRPLTKYL